MTQREQKLVDKVSKLEPQDRRVLVHAHKVRTYKDKAFNAIPKDPDSDPMDPEREMIMEETIADINYRYQKATVLRVSNNTTTKLEPGDIVIYEIGKLKEFDLVKDVSILRDYDVEFIEVDPTIDKTPKIY